MEGNKLFGRRYIALVRCSTKGQADTSIVDQLILLERFAQARGMIHVDEIRLEGVSGSRPGARHDLEDLIRRKRERDDFDTLLVQDVSRLTRSGPQHAAKIEYDLGAVGIEVVYAADVIPDGDAGDIIKAVLHAQAKQHAKAISFASSRGAMSAIKDGRSAYCRRPPYGVDKRYHGPDGRAHHIIRLEADGTQIMLHPETGAVMQRFGRNEETGAPRHYQKQRDERVELVPGAPERIDVVCSIYRWHYHGQWGYVRIARALNDHGIVSPQGSRWHAEQVRQILHNPIYTGLGIANRFSSAIFHERAADAPHPVQIDRAVLANRERLPVRVRPRAEWVEEELDVFKNLLDDDIRDLARERHKAHLDAQAAGRTPKPNKDRHKQSAFFLKGVLTARQGGHQLTGRRTGTKEHRRRYYGVAKSRAHNTSADPVLRKLIPAEPLERAVLELLRTVLLQRPDLERDVRAAVKRVVDRASAPGQQIDDLQQERERQRGKIAFAFEHMDDVGKDAARDEIERAQARVRALDAEIERRSGASNMPVDADQLVKRVMDTLTNLGEQLDQLPRAQLRSLVAAFVARAAVDLATRDVEIEIRLPEWALLGQEPMCLDPRFDWKPGNEAHEASGLLMLSPQLIWVQESYSYGAVDFSVAA